MSEVLYIKKTCPECDGLGKFLTSSNEYQDDCGYYEWVNRTVSCNNCNGTGNVFKPKSQ